MKILIAQIKEHVARYSTSLFSLINEFIASDLLINDKSSIQKSILDISALKSSSLNEIIDLIDALNTHAWSYVKEYIYFLIPKVMQIIEKTKKNKEKLALKSIGLLRSIQSSMLDDYLYLIIPEMIKIWSKNNPVMRKDAIELLLKVVRCKHFEEYIVQVVHSFIKILDETTDKIFYAKFLLELGRVSRSLFSPFILLVFNSFKKYKINEEEYEIQLQSIAYDNSCK